MRDGGLPQSDLYKGKSESFEKAIASSIPSNRSAMPSTPGTSIGLPISDIDLECPETFVMPESKFR
jgi:hypothetical protein